MAGDVRPTTVEVAGVRVGLMTCYDLRFPELARELSRAETQLVVVPSAWVAGPRKVHHWRTLVTARAIENVSYVAAVGQSEPRYTGHSLLVDPRGETRRGGRRARRGGRRRALLDAARGGARRENPSLLNRRDDAPEPRNAVHGSHSHARSRSSAEMVANVVQVYVGPGDPVEQGDTVVLLESMKMEIPVLSERAGTVSSVNVDAGDVVQEGDSLITLALS